MAKKTTRWQPAPLKGSFMVISIVGFLVSMYVVYDISSRWAYAFMFLFFLMFIASIISMTKAPVITREAK